MTLQQVAERAGVSASTVSRVINSMPGITAETADTVRRAIAEMAYTPSIRRRGGARSEPASMVGAKVAFMVLTQGTMGAVPAYDYLLRGVSAAAVRYQVDLHVSFPTDTRGAINMLGRAAFDGLILHGMINPTESSRPLHHIPTVWLLGNRRRPSWGDQVMPDNATVGQIAAQYLLRNNHRKVIYFGMRSGWSLGIRMLAFQQAMEDAGANVITINHELADFNTFQPQDSEQGIATLIRTYREAKEKPTGIFIAEDWLVRLVYNAFRDAGYEIGGPNGIEVISCNNDRAHLVGVDPVPATIDIRYEEIGYRALEQLVHRLTHKGPSDRIRIMLEPALLPPPGAVS